MLNPALNTIDGGIVTPNPYPVKTLLITDVPLPDKVVLPLQQHTGEQAQPCVKVGDKVLTGQIIASPQDAFGVPIHASISGLVTLIDEQIIPHKSGLKSLSISIKSDGKDKWIKQKHTYQDFRNHSPEALIKQIRYCGIVGLGGAGFPTHIKMTKAQNCQTLIINGTECEPGIMCDDALMQNYPEQIICGVEILLHICGADKAIIAIEDDKQEAFSSLQKHNTNQQIKIQQIATKYTSGAEKLLIKALLNIEIPSNSFSVDHRILCQNIATTKAIFDAVIDDKPLVSRIITVTGSAVAQPGNFQVRLGVSFSSIIALSKPNTAPYTLRIGGMMMGLDLPSDTMMIGKTSNCIFVNNVVEKPPAQPCIRCGQCAQVCPIGLLPQQLYWYAKSQNISKVNDYNLTDCILCACCDYVCPSHIKLAEHFAFAKALNRQQIQQQKQTDIARERFEYRQYRLERNKLERAKMMAEKKKALQQKMATEQAQKTKIMAAIERIKKRPK